MPMTGTKDLCSCEATLLPSCDTGYTAKIVSSEDLSPRILRQASEIECEIECAKDDNDCGPNVCRPESAEETEARLAQNVSIA